MYTGRPPYMERLNDISFWYPILEELSAASRMPEINMFRTDEGNIESSETYKDFVLNIPETYLFITPKEIGKIADGKKTDAFIRLVTDVDDARKRLGGEAFLRTGQTSNKHEWERTCHLTDKSVVTSNVYNLIEFSMMVDLPYTTWAVRKMIETSAVTTAFEGMPIARELRLFVKAGKVVCAHPYWPHEALDDQANVTADQIAALQQMPAMAEITAMAEYISQHFQGAWSVDFLEDIEGKWWVTDMALASTSYHWPGCERAKAKS